MSRTKVQSEKKDVKKSNDTFLNSQFVKLERREPFKASVLIKALDKDGNPTDEFRSLCTSGGYFTAVLLERTEKSEGKSDVVMKKAYRRILPKANVIDEPHAEGYDALQETLREAEAEGAIELERRGK